MQSDSQLPDAPPGSAPCSGSEVPTPRTNEEVRLCRVKSSAFGDMVGADFAQKLERENQLLKNALTKECPDKIWT